MVQQGIALLAPFFLHALFVLNTDRVSSRLIQEQRRDERADSRD